MPPLPGRILFCLVLSTAFAVAAVATGEEPAPGPFLRVLGTAQDGGFPHAGCACDRCDLAREQPEVARHVASLAIVIPAEGSVYLVDATPDLRIQLDMLSDVRDAPDDRADRSPVDGVLLTHAHIGHYLGLADFGFEALSTSELPVYCTPRMARFLRKNGPWSQLVSKENISIREVKPQSSFELGGGVAVRALTVPHRDEYSDTVAFRIEGPGKSVLYVPDTDAWEKWDPPFLEQLEGVDVALLDATFYSAGELPGRAIEEIPHPLVESTMDLLADRVQAGALEVWFTHLNHSNPMLRHGSEAARKVRERGFGTLEDGQEISLW